MDEKSGKITCVEICVQNVHLLGVIESDYVKDARDPVPPPFLTTELVGSP